MHACLYTYTQKKEKKAGTKEEKRRVQLTTPSSPIHSERGAWDGDPSFDLVVVVQDLRRLRGSIPLLLAPFLCVGIGLRVGRWVYAPFLWV
jgi:hypothetical protein